MLMSTKAFAYDLEIEGIRYDVVSFTDLTVKATSLSPDKKGEIKITPSITYGKKTLKVVGLGKKFAMGNKQITSIYIEGIDSISEDAFCDCQNLQTITIGESVKVIDNYAFKNCINIKNVQLGDNISILNEGVFEGCIKLETCSCNKKIDTIGNRAFYKCSSLKELVIPSSTTNIGNSAFAHCNKLEAIEIPDNVTKLGYTVFAGCKNLKTVSLGTGISILHNSFGDCEKLEKIVIKDSKTPLIIDNKTSEQEKYPGDNIRYTTYVVYESLFYCKNIKEAYIGRNLTTKPFCYWVQYSQDYSYSDCKYYVPNPIFSESKIEKVTIGPLVTQLPTFGYTAVEAENSFKGSFENCKNLKTVELLGNNINAIPAKAFKGCSSLQNIVLKNINRIEKNAFEGCLSLDSIVLGKKLSSINTDAFKKCEAIKKIVSYAMTPPVCQSEFESKVYVQAELTIPFESQNTYGSSNLWKKFWNISEGVITQFTQKGIVYEVQEEDTVSTCGNRFKPFAKITIPSTVTYKEHNYIVSSIGPNTFKDCLSEAIEIPNSITSIGEKAFYNFHSTQTKTLIIPNSVKYIGSHAFSESGFVSFELPKDFTDIGNIFSQCRDLEEFKIPYGTTAICDSAFADCSLKKIYIPETVYSIGNYAFYGCDNLKNIDIPNSVTSIGEGAFKDCSDLKEIKLSKNLDAIKDNTFSGCSYLESLTIPTKVSYIGKFAFEWCWRLKEITIPKNVKFIKSHAFYGLSHFHKIKFEGGVPDMEEKAFENTPYLKDMEIGGGGDFPFLIGKHDHCSKYITTKVNGIDVKFNIDYYFGYFKSFPVENLYIGCNLNSKSRYSIYEKERGVYNVTSYDGPFSECANLKKLRIGKEVSKLGPEEQTIKEINGTITAGSFKRCDALDSIFVEATIPPTGAEFSETAYKKAVLIVPEESLEQYKQAKGWKGFYTILTPSTTAIKNIYDNNTDISIKTTNDGVVVLGAEGSFVNIYSISGELVYHINKYHNNAIYLQHGIYIIKVNKKSIKIII